MIRVFTTKNLIKGLLDQEDHARARDLNSAKLTNDLRFIQREGHADASEMDYIYNLVEYPSRIKKLFIKGNSKKEVPRQVLNIVTNSFQTFPKVFFSRYDVEFEEFTDAVVADAPPPPVARAQVERTAQIEEERDQAIVRVERAEERTARAEVRAVRAEARATRTNVRTGTGRDERLDDEQYGDERMSEEME